MEIFLHLLLPILWIFVNGIPYMTFALCALYKTGAHKWTCFEVGYTRSSILVDLQKPVTVLTFITTAGAWCVVKTHADLRVYEA